MKQYLIIYGPADSWGLARCVLITAQNGEEAIKAFRRTHKGRKIQGIAIYPKTKPKRRRRR